mgnify:CR=1 FL=1
MNEIIEKMVECRKDLSVSRIVSLENALHSLKDIQSVVSLPVEGCIPVEGELPSKDAIRTYVLAMTVELMEFVQTLDWKPWKQKSNLDIERIVDEFADILAFQGVLIYYLYLLGISPEMLELGYRKKSIENIDRFLGKKGAEYKQPSLF